MPYSQEHKAQSRQRILASAFKLFFARGYDNVSINQIMAEADMTRGAFYAHFENKGLLYREAIIFAAENSEIVREKPDELNEKQWMRTLLEGYLHKDNISKNNHCPLAALVTDVTVREPEVRDAYTRTFKGMNKRIAGYTKTYSSCSKNRIMATTAMIIGGLAIARAIDDPQLSEQLLENCKLEAQKLLDTD